MSHSNTATAVVNSASLADRINQAHRDAQAAITEGLLQAKTAGELLVEAKAQCPHGTWGKWLDENFQGSDRRAQRYMTIAKRWPELEAKATRVSDLPYREAVKLLGQSAADCDSDLWGEYVRSELAKNKARLAALDGITDLVERFREGLRIRRAAKLLVAKTEAAYAIVGGR